MFKIWVHQIDDLLYSGLPRRTLMVIVIDIKFVRSISCDFFYPAYSTFLACSLKLLAFIDPAIVPYMFIIKECLNCEGQQNEQSAGLRLSYKCCGVMWFNPFSSWQSLVYMCIVVGDPIIKKQRVGIP